MGDNESFYKAVRRMISAAFRRAGEGDPEIEFRDLGDLSRFVRDLEAQAVKVYRVKGCTWEQIGASFGLSRQAAYQRWGKVQGE
jgi:hypothetical protein